MKSQSAFNGFSVAVMRAGISPAHGAIKDEVFLQDEAVQLSAAPALQR